MSESATPAGDAEQRGNDADDEARNDTGDDLYPAGECRRDGGIGAVSEQEHARRSPPAALQ